MIPVLPFCSIVSMLIPATSKVKVQCSGISPLHLAAEHNRDWILEVLIKGGYDVNLQLAEDRSKMYEDRRSTALYFAVANNNLEASEMLLEAGANPNLDMFNPLLIAVRRGCMEIITVLVEHGANMNASILTHPCSFPAVVMLGMKYSQILKYLMDNGCDALSCFDCTYGSKPHPPLQTLSRGRDFAETLRYANDEDEAPINMCIQVGWVNMQYRQFAGLFVSNSISAQYPYTRIQFVFSSVRRSTIRQ